MKRQIVIPMCFVFTHCLAIVMGRDDG